jgi:hypothetical protein
VALQVILVVAVVVVRVALVVVALDPWDKSYKKGRIWVIEVVVLVEEW